MNPTDDFTALWKCFHKPIPCLLKGSKMERQCGC